MNELDPNTKKAIQDLVYDFFAEECEVEVSSLSNQTHIIEELEGDSLMLLSLLEMVRKQYNLSIELKTLGKHLMRKPVNTLGDVVALTQAVVIHGDNIVNVSL